MSEPRTQDIQKVFNSATQNLQSFIGNVDNVSSTKNVEMIYGNMAKLFESFASNVLTQQGANSSIVLRTIYRGLDENFSQILQNPQLVDKINDVIGKYKSAGKSNSDDKGILGDQKPIVDSNVDVQDVIVDFIDKLQYAILKIRQELIRKKQIQAIKYKQLYDNQNSDIQDLNQELARVNGESLNMLEQAQDEDKVSLEQNITKTNEILNQIENAINGSGFEGGIEFKYKNQRKENISVDAKSESKLIDTIISKVEQIGKKASNDNIWVKQQSESKNKDVVVKPRFDVKNKLNQINGLKNDATHLNVSPHKNSGECICPICGNVHSVGGKNVHHHEIDEQKNKQTPKSNGITTSGVLLTLGIITNSINSMVKEQKFKNQFILNYGGIQKGIGKKMGGISKDEEKINDYFKKTDKGIQKLHDQNRKKKGSLLSMLMNPLGFLAKAGIFAGTFAVGSLLLITMTRMALSSWKKKYMPEGGQGKFTLFGVEIPFVNDIKNVCLGIYNSIRVGIPNAFGKISKWFSGVKKLLFGKNGILSSAEEVRNTLRKIATAYIIGLTKKVGGTAVLWLINILAPILNIALPGSGIALKLIVTLCPMIYSFVLNQIQMIWNNHKADAELAIKKLNIKNTIADIRGKLISASSGVHDFVPPKLIPGLEAPKQGRMTRGRQKSAIMRRVTTNVVSDVGRTKAIQDVQYDKKIDKINSKRINDITLEQGKDSFANDMMNANVDGRSFTNRDWSERRQMLDWHKKNIIDPQFAALDRYIELLNSRQNTRFQNVKGVLYDINTGWNPGYAVHDYDLMTAIPLTPFGKMHQKNDISFGTPFGTSDQYLGIKPFSWYQNGVPIEANPISFELQRAKKIRKIMADFYNMASYILLSSNQYSEQIARILPSYQKDWIKANYITKGGYGDDVWYKDRFSNFFNKLKEGNIDSSNNSIKGAEELEKSWFRKLYDKSKVGGVSLGMYGVAINSASSSIDKQSNDMKRVLSYNKKKNEKYEKTSGKGFWGGLKAIGKNIVSATKNAKNKFDSVYWLNKFRDIQFNGMSYGMIRKLMLDGGILSMFKGREIYGTIGKANTLISQLLNYAILDKMDNKNGEPPLHALLWPFFQSQKISGYKWDNMKNDDVALSGMSQSLLEYFALNIIPQWNLVERLLSHVISNDGDKTTDLMKGIKRLIGMFAKNSIFQFMGDHLRFPNMKIRLVDESNATKYQLKQIYKFKEDFGIISDKSFGKFLEKIGRGDKKDLQKRISMLEDQIQKVKYEVKYNGTGQDRLEKLQDMLSKLLGEESGKSIKDSKIVDPSVVKATNVTVTPPKTKEQLDKEENERKLREAEQKKREQEEKKKKLEEEAKRREQVAIAKAKIAAMESIRKQEQNYESILEKMISDPSKVTDAELNSLGKDVDDLKQEAENRINELPREERDLKLALIRGDKVSDKTFKELKDTSIGLNGSLMQYVGEVRKIPCGSIVSISNQSQPNIEPIKMQDSDDVDLGDD